jgi:Protein of unknown function (DUF3307)
MITASAWLTKLVLAHLLTDFILQPKSWIDQRKTNHFASSKLYLHGFITGLLAWIMMGLQYWPVAIIILVTHTLIDGWKSYRQNTVTYFLIDQLLHLLVIAGCWYFVFIKWTDAVLAWQQFNKQTTSWKTITALAFLTAPAGFLIGQFTRQ